MNIKITSKDFELTPNIDEYVNKKIASLERFMDQTREILCEVELGRTTKHHQSGDIFRAEVNISEPGVGQYYASAEEIDIYTAIDKVRDEAERAIVSKRAKKSTLFRKGSAVVKGLLKRIKS